MSADFIKNITDPSNFVGILFLAILLAAVILLLLWAVRKFGLNIRLGKIGIFGARKETKAEAKERMTHTNCPLVGDVLHIVSNVKHYAYEVYKLRHISLLHDQMKFAEARLELMFDTIGRKYAEELEKNNQTVEEPNCRDRALLCRVFGQVLRDRYLEYLRIAFIENGLEKMSASEFTAYKSSQVEILLSKGEEFIESHYPLSLIGGKDSRCLRFYSSEHQNRIKEELNRIFDHAKELSAEITNKEDELSAAFNENLGQILRGEYRANADLPKA